jgi:hypothetical protein
LLLIVLGLIIGIAVSGCCDDFDLSFLVVVSSSTGLRHDRTFPLIKAEKSELVINLVDDDKDFACLLAVAFKEVGRFGTFPFLPAMEIENSEPAILSSDFEEVDSVAVFSTDLLESSRRDDLHGGGLTNVCLRKLVSVFTTDEAPLAKASKLLDFLTRLVNEMLSLSPAVLAT